MTFISYAQNQEDVIIQRIFSHLNDGFYVDVGANDPVIDSITKAFYDRGWTGVNIEPAYAFFKKLVAERPRDINMNCAAGSRNSVINFHSIPETGLSTAIDTIAKIHSERGWISQDTTIPVFKLNDILAPYAGRAIHFLKIDVEGMESEVIAGLDLAKFRPWVLIVEATAPLSQTLTYEVWEPAILKNNYDFVYFDGLNRYYLANEHPSLKSKFTYPPCFFDDYVTIGTVNMAQKLNETKMQIECFIKESADLNEKLKMLTNSLQAEEARANTLQAELEKTKREASQKIITATEKALSLTKQNCEAAISLERASQRILAMELAGRHSSDQIINFQTELTRLQKKLDSKVLQLEEIGNTNHRITYENMQTREALAKLMADSDAQAIRAQSEIQRLRKLLYSTSASTHVYRALCVAVGDKHYKESKPNAEKPLKCYTNLHVPWHTHLYRAAMGISVKGEKPWHTHLYRCVASVFGNPRYKQIQSSKGINSTSRYQDPSTIETAAAAAKHAERIEISNAVVRMPSNPHFFKPTANPPLIISPLQSKDKMTSDLVKHFNEIKRHSGI